MRDTSVSGDFMQACLNTDVMQKRCALCESPGTCTLPFLLLCGRRQAFNVTQKVRIHVIDCFLIGDQLQTSDAVADAEQLVTDGSFVVADAELSTATADEAPFPERPIHDD